MPQLTRRSLLSLAAPRPGLGAGAAPPRLNQSDGPSWSMAVDTVQYDVFTDTPLAGNQLAVFIETAGLTAAQMQAMTRETKFSECTFVQPPEAAGTDVRLRIFGPANEMQFAGHPGDRLDIRAGRRWGDRGGTQRIYVWPGDWSDAGRARVAGRSAAVRVDDAAEAGLRTHAERAGCPGRGAGPRGVGDAARRAAAGSDVRLGVHHGAAGVARRRRSGGGRSSAP